MLHSCDDRRSKVIRLDRWVGSTKGVEVAKDKKKKGKDKAKAGKGGASKLKAFAENPIVADLVAAALVSTAAALKDPGKARAMAGDAQDELTAMARDASKKGSAMWKLALEVGRQALDTLVGEAKGSKVAKAVKKPAAKVARKAPKATAKPAAKVARKTASKAAKATAKTASKAARKAPARKSTAKAKLGA